ncbi:hypothetical protein KL911_000795 [Ogataea haglerorum]|uniref:uncharacterized protein n=1 Tax=Ogataea haglerorum TaxID=1937702 RepID=UPI001C8A8216|nr:uncharacterized protein KL911_000795 [Ogataea haglerorum]KAG7750387.1 hypothetical protein KL912_000947 [Ogataea haglerorum]KAG7757819.1 hypothetical protein KL911_000795 [Ogataea haglerorum]
MSSPKQSPIGSRTNSSTIDYRKKINIYDTVLQLIRIILASIYLFYIVLTIPLSFEIGGIDCGLSYSITILLIYFCLATLRVLKYHRIISSFLYYTQHFLLPSLLSIFLTVFTSSDEYNASTLMKKIWWHFIIKSWKLFLMNSTPLFTILEGFCSLLSIQAIGQMSQYLIKHKSDTWSIVNLITSACILSSCLFFFVKIYVSPIDLQRVGLISASLLGSAFTCTILITIFGIYSGKASPLECSLMVAYIVKCCYELFPELSELNFNMLLKFIMNEFKNLDYQANSLNKEFLNSIQTTFNNFRTGRDLFEYVHFEFLAKSTTKDKLLLVYVKVKEFIVDVVIKFITENFPKSFESLWDFLKISISNLTFSILIQLAYRICVFFAATKIIPILQPVQKGSPLSTPSSPTPTKMNRHEKSARNKSTSSRLIYLYSPCIIIAVYTNLMIQYIDELDSHNHFWNWLNFQFRGTSAQVPEVSNSVHSWQVWNWINIFGVLLLYSLELMSHDPDDSSLTDHWSI